MSTDLHCSLSVEQLAEYTARQLNAFFPDPEPAQPGPLQAGVRWTLERLAKIHRVVAPPTSKYYFLNGAPRFDHLHGDQYATYIYFLSRYCATQLDDRQLATKLYLLNRALFSVDIYFEVELPEIFLLCHPAGSVLGRASYQDYLVVCQNCTVGGIGDVYPVLEKGVVLNCDVTVIGSSHLGASTCVGAGSLLVNLHVPPGRTVVGRAREARILPGEKELWREFFNVPPLH